jgi:catechol 2,3-dioxygenase-like lactoylglutathione lyase family enzyme
MNRPRLPGLRGVDHVGLTVPDMRAAVEFFVGVIGCEPYYGFGPMRDDETDSFEESFGIHPRAVLNEIKLLRLGNLNIELFEWDDSHDGQAVPPLNWAEDMSCACTWMTSTSPSRICASGASK